MSDPTPEQVQAEDHTFLGSVALAGALHDVLADHVSLVGGEPPDCYIWCACGWRSDDHGLLPRNAQAGHTVHLTNAVHQAAVVALRPRIATERADAARQALAPVLALADEWERESRRYQHYVEGSTIPNNLASIAKTLAQNAASLRAAAGGGEGQ